MSHLYTLSWYTGTPATYLQKDTCLAVLRDFLPENLVERWATPSCPLYVTFINLLVLTQEIIWN